MVVGLPLLVNELDTAGTEAGVEERSSRCGPSPTHTTDISYILTEEGKSLCVL